MSGYRENGEVENWPNQGVSLCERSDRDDRMVSGVVFVGERYGALEVDDMCLPIEVGDGCEIGDE